MKNVYLSKLRGTKTNDCVCFFKEEFISSSVDL